MDLDTLVNTLRSIRSNIDGHDLGDGAFEVVIPDSRRTHDPISISVESGVDEWLISDLGASAFLLGDEFDTVVEAMICAGAPFEDEDGTLVLRTKSTATEFELAENVMRFAATIGSVPLVWHSLACAAPHKEATPSTIMIMARDAQGSIIRAAPKAQPFLAIDNRVKGAIERVNAPLQFRLDSTRSPQLVAGCIDFTAGPQGEAAAKRLSSYLWDTVHEMPSIERYAIVRGSEQQVERIAHLYDQRNVTTVSSDNLGSLTESVAQLVDNVLR